LHANGQTYTVLKSFGTLTNISGYNPRAQLVQGADGTLYGTTSKSEISTLQGTVFKVQPDGSGFTVLKWFTINRSIKYFTHELGYDRLPA
jgi:uncharacterized repeat protein (TIGR03803 family)